MLVQAKLIDLLRKVSRKGLSACLWEGGMAGTSLMPGGERVAFHPPFPEPPPSAASAQLRCREQAVTIQYPAVPLCSALPRGVR